MKTQVNNRTFKRTLRVSFRIGIIYSLIYLIWILLAGKFNEEGYSLEYSIILLKFQFHWPYWTNLLVNFAVIFTGTIISVFAYKINEHVTPLAYIFPALPIGIFFGMVSGKVLQKGWKWLISCVIIIFIISCTEDVTNILIEDEKPPVQKESVFFTRAVETSPNEACPDGGFLIEQFRDSVRTLIVSICKEKEKVFLPGDSILIPGDTITKIRIDTIIQIEKLPGDTITKIERDTIPKIKIDTIFVDKNHFIVREFFREGFNNDGNSPYYHSIGWNLGKGFSINSIESENQNGSIVLWDNLDLDTIWSPEVFSEPMQIDSISWNIGSMNCYLVKFLLEDKQGNIFVIGTMNSFVENFDWQEISTYNRFIYSSKTGISNIVRVGLAVQKLGTFLPEERNEKFNADELFVRGIKFISKK